MLKIRRFYSCIPLFYRFSPLMPVIVCHSFQSVGSVGATQQLHPLTLGRPDFCAPATEHLPGTWLIQALCVCKQTVSSLETWALNVCPITACWGPVEPQAAPWHMDGGVSAVVPDQMPRHCACCQPTQVPGSVRPQCRLQRSCNCRGPHPARAPNLSK